MHFLYYLFKVYLFVFVIIQLKYEHVIQAFTVFIKSTNWLSGSYTTSYYTRNPDNHLYVSSSDQGDDDICNNNQEGQHKNQYNALVDNKNGKGDEDAFECCWRANTSTVNALDTDDINEILQCMNSPAPQAFFALTRGLENGFRGPDDCHDAFRIFSCMLKPGYKFIIRDYGGSGVAAAGASSSYCYDWRIARVSEPGVALRVTESGWHVIQLEETVRSTLAIAHHVLTRVIEASESNTPVEDGEIDMLVNTTISRLRITLGVDLRGRTSADAAFCFAMAGVANEELYATLATIAYLELDRTGHRPSFPIKHILQIVEKLTSAGIRGTLMDRVYTLAAHLLTLKQENGRYDDLIHELLQGRYGLHSARPLLWLWRFSKKQKKPMISVKTSTTTKMPYESTVSCIDAFKYPSRPLVVDIGSGMGVSLQGLATYNTTTTTVNQQHSDTRNSLLSSIQYNNCNYLGCDLNLLLLRYSKSISKRWLLQDQLQFKYTAAQHLLYDLSSQTNNTVKLIMIQFPTPYKLQLLPGARSNTQLPSNTSQFMVTKELLQTACTILTKSSEQGYLLLSNCEDVAVYMKHLAIHEAGLLSIDAEYPVHEHILGEALLSKRTQEWLLSNHSKGGGGGNETIINDNSNRAIGSCWSSIPLLPRQGQTETEVACQIQSTPIHRCLFKPSTTFF